MTQKIILPNEILQRIFLQIDSAECWSNLRLVSNSIKEIIESKIFWIQKLSDLNSNKNYCNESVEEMVKGCITSEAELREWKFREGGIGFGKSAKKLETYAFVDCVEIILCKFGYLIFAGSRDRAIRAWKITDFKIPFIQKIDSHLSWVKHLAALPNNQLLSFGYDGSLTLWDIQFQHLFKLQSINLKSTVLDYALNSSQLFTVSVDNNIRQISYSFKKLLPKWSVKYFKVQTTAITCSKNHSKLGHTVVYCASKNGWIVSLNSANWKKLDSLKFEDTVLSLKFVGDEIYCGLSDADLVILSPNLTILKKIQVFSARISVNQVVGSLSCIGCISTGGSIHILERQTMKEVFRGSLNQKIIFATSFSSNFVFISNDGTISALSNANFIKTLS